MRNSSHTSMPDNGTFTLLVIDDDIIQRTILCKIGTQAGFGVTSAASHDEASNMLAQTKYDCVTLDLSLGKESGAVLLRTMVETGNNVPVVIISGAEEYILKATQEIAKSLGLDAFLLNKPLKLTEIRETLTQKRRSAHARRIVNELRTSLDEEARHQV
jgi:DNA-binding NtrC family response regulator